MRQNIGRFPAKRASTAAKGTAKYFVAVFAYNFILFVARDILSRPVEKKDLSACIVSYDPFHQMIENVFEVPFIRDEIL